MGVISSRNRVPVSAISKRPAGSVNIRPNKVLSHDHAGSSAVRPEAAFVFWASMQIELVGQVPLTDYSINSELGRSEEQGAG
jgi:hypothetical protein